MFLSIPEIAISKCLCVLISPSIILLFKKLMLYNLTPLFFFGRKLVCIMYQKIILWWQRLRCCTFSANLALGLLFFLNNFCFYCTMIMHNWHVTEIPQKLNSQEKILRWGPKDPFTGKLFFTVHECKCAWTCAVHEDMHSLLKWSQMNSSKSCSKEKSNLRPRWKYDSGEDVLRNFFVWSQALRLLRNNKMFQQ